jgi:site-specific DNA-methyltransferase (adenine-specific)
MQPYYQDDAVTIYHGDCLEVMAVLPDASIDAVICDPPYGTTACTWDSVIPFVPMWERLKRLIKSRSPIVLFGSQPFTSALIMSNPQQFRYEWVWDKRLAGNPFVARYQPLKVHENILVFSREAHNYNPQMRIGQMKQKGGGYSKLFGVDCTITRNDQYHPTSIVAHSNGDRNGKTIYHPTQKPLALMEYLVNTYTNAGDTVLDFTCGSGTTLRAAKNLNRRAVGIEQSEHYCEIAARRMAQEVLVLAV